MEIALILLFPLLGALGLNKLRLLFQLAWQTNTVKNQILEARFGLALQKIWLHRWRIAAWSGLYVALCLAAFLIGIFTSDRFYIILSGLAFTIFIWTIGFLAHKLVFVYQKLINHLEQGGQHTLPPPESIAWLQFFGALGRRLCLIPIHGDEAKQFLEKISDTYRLIMLIPLFFTFFLGLFPDVKIWFMSLVIFTGAMAWLLLSRMLREDPKKTLRGIKLMVAVWVLGTLAITKLIAMFPNITTSIGIHLKPLVEQRVVAWSHERLSPTSPSPSPNPTPPLPPSPNNFGPAKNDVLKKINITNSNNGSNSNDKNNGSAVKTDVTSPTNEVVSPERKNIDNDRLKKLKEDFPDIDFEAKEPVEQPKSNTSTASDTLNILNLPPVEQLPK